MVAKKPVDPNLGPAENGLLAVLVQNPRSTFETLQRITGASTLSSIKQRVYNLGRKMKASGETCYKVFKKYAPPMTGKKGRQAGPKVNGAAALSALGINIDDFVDEDEDDFDSDE